MLADLDERRRAVSASLDAESRAKLGQFLTPATVARFMAGLFPASAPAFCRLLDPGAGIGSLSSAVLDRWSQGGFGFKQVALTAFEIDPVMHAHLRTALAAHSAAVPLEADIVTGDFVENAVNWLQFRPHAGFTHAILNPPYKKISSDSRHRHLLRAVGIETVNLYSAFVALSVAMLAPGGQLVAIIPRSFCNGPYYRPFRDFLLDRAAIRHMHLFAARDKAFKDDAVLQENLILLLEKHARQDAVTVSTSTDDRFDDYASHLLPFERIVSPDDRERFIHVPTSAGVGALDESSVFNQTLDGLGLQVCTGPVVDFRLRPWLCKEPQPGSVPLLYSSHFGDGGLNWPLAGFKKWNAIARNVETEKWLMPNGNYTIVRRFSSKEERRRVVAHVFDKTALPGCDAVGFENHLNVFHAGKRGIQAELACGLAVFLNSTAVDQTFRRFNGHTQVNATDLRSLRYPSRVALLALGAWANQQPEALSQEAIDHKIAGLSFSA